MLNFEGPMNFMQRVKNLLVHSVTFCISAYIEYSAKQFYELDLPYFGCFGLEIYGMKLFISHWADSRERDFMQYQSLPFQFLVIN